MIYVKVFTGELSTTACRLYVLFIDLQLTNKDIADSIDAEVDGDLQKAFMTIGMQIKYLFIINRTKMFILWIVICFNKCIVPACSIRIAEISVRMQESFCYAGTLVTQAVSKFKHLCFWIVFPMTIYSNKFTKKVLFCEFVKS